MAYGLGFRVEGLDLPRLGLKFSGQGFVFGVQGPALGLGFPAVRLRVARRRSKNQEDLALHDKEFLSNPEGPSTPYYRTLVTFWVPKSINKDYLDLRVRFKTCSSITEWG